ncbi:hypothetical protein [Brevundimonas sp.]|jgi:hypothetical protein|uniref:hypothetical protein n=1 Tax=Brevundimonas sp. TaxID=1871086 RepID=UPI0037C00676
MRTPNESEQAFIEENILFTLKALAELAEASGSRFQSSLKDCVTWLECDQLDYALSQTLN